MSSNFKDTMIFLLFLSVTAAFSAVTGRVVDGSGNPVSDATVMYADWHYAYIYEFTDENGEFSLPSPDEWSLTSAVSTDAGISSKNRSNSAAPKNIMIRNGRVFLSLEGKGKLVTVDLYNLSGRHLNRVFNEKLSAGRHSIDPLSSLKSAPAKQVFIVKAKAGNQTVSGRVAYIDNSSHQATGSFAETTGENMLSKPSAVSAIGEVRAGKTGYEPYSVSIDSYDEAVGDMAITTVDIEAKVDSLLALMTLEEKAGQTCQSGGSIATLFLGSALKTSSYASNESWQNDALSTRLGIPIIQATDYVHGGTKVYFPHNIGLGSTGNPKLVEMAYRFYALGLMGDGCWMNFAPCVDVPRYEGYGRVYEGFSETPEITVMMARAAVRGEQLTDLSSPYTLAACVKHYTAAGGTEDGRMKSSTNETLDVIGRIHNPGFKAAVDAGAASIMTAYCDINNVGMTRHEGLITDTLKNSWGFDGFTISDWEMADEDGHVNCMNAGLDMAMEPGDPDIYCSNIINAVNGGQISESRLDDAVKRVLRVKFRMKIFDHIMTNDDLDALQDSDVGHEAARMCVRQSLVLLKNENSVLPIDKSAKVHMVGQWISNIGIQCGGWTESWMGEINDNLTDGTNIREGMIEVAGSDNITYSTDANSIPSDADVVIVGGGEPPYAEYGGFRSVGDIVLSDEHKSLITTAAASGKPVVFLYIGGRPLVMTDIVDDCDAIVCCWLPGDEGAGVADVLYGDYDFKGTLPITWPISTEQIPINEGDLGDRSGSGGDPLYPVGYGLTYN